MDSGARVGMVHVIAALSLLDPLVALDWRIQREIQTWRSPSLDPVMKAVTDVGKPQIVVGSLLGIALFTGPAGPATARVALAALVPTNAAVEITKRGVNRVRPDGEHKRSNASFPSSHAANAFAIALVFTYRWRRLAPAFILFAAVVAFSRVYLNRHFASDVLFGAGIGLLFAWTAHRLRRRIGRTEAGAPAQPNS